MGWSNAVLERERERESVCTWFTNDDVLLTPKRRGEAICCTNHGFVTTAVVAAVARRIL